MNNNTNGFRFWCKNVLPIIYNDTLSTYEILCKLIEYLNKLIEDTKNLSDNVTELYKLYSELQSYIDNYFINLDVQEEINNKLDEMYRSGVLDSVLRPILFDTPLSEFCDTKVFAQIILDNYLDMSSYGVQGFAIGNVDGANILCVSAITNSSDNGVLATYNITTGELLNIKMGLSIGHANGITYCDKDKHFYIACAGGSNGINKVSVYNHNLDFVKDIDFNNKLTGFPYGIAYNSEIESFYIVLSNGIIGEFDYNFNVIKHGTLESQNDIDYTAQSIWTDNKYLYFILNDLSSGTRWNKFDIYHLADFSLYKKQYVLINGELESCCYFNKELYLLINSSHAGLLYKGCQYNDNKVYEYVPANFYDGNYISMNNNYVDYWYDSNYNGFFVDNTENRPFNKFYHMTANAYRNSKSALRWNIKGEITHGINIKRFFQAIYINGVNDNNGNRPKIAGLYFKNIHQLAIDNIEITKRNDVSNTLLELQYITYAYLRNIIFKGSGTENNSLHSIACSWNLDTSEFVSQTTYHTIYAGEGGGGVIGNSNIFYADATVGSSVNTSIDFPYRSQYSLALKSIGGLTTVFPQGENIDITKILRNGQYRTEGNNTFVKVPPKLQTGAMCFNVSNMHDNDSTNALRRYDVYKYTEYEHWIGITSINGTIMWYADYHTVFNINIDTNFLVDTSNISLSTDDYRTGTFNGIVRTNTDINNNDVIARLNTTFFTPNTNSYTLYATSIDGKVYLLSFKNGEIIALSSIPNNTHLRIQGNYFFPKFEYQLAD